MSQPIEIDSRQFRSALGAFTTGVTIVTTCDEEGRDVGLTANSFNSVSMNPPMVLWSLDKSSRSLPAFMENDHFAVHVLSADQQHLSDRFASRGVDKFAGLEPGRGVGGVALLEDCSARFECETAFRYDGGDHIIFVGNVTKFNHFDRAPLVFHSGGYGMLVKKEKSKPDDVVAEALLKDDVESSFRKDFLGYLLAVAHHKLFLDIRREYRSQDLTENEYYLLTILGIDDDRSLEELEQLIEYSGGEASPGLVNGLIERDLVASQVDESGRARLRLTEKGKQLVLRFFAVAKAAESHADNALDYGESQMLKQLLKRLIRGGGEPASMPTLWPRPENDAS